MLQISMQTERGRKRTRVSVMKLIYCSVILGFFLTSPICRALSNVFGEVVLFFTLSISTPKFRWLLAPCHLKIRFEQTVFWCPTYNCPFKF